MMSCVDFGHYPEIKGRSTDTGGTFMFEHSNHKLGEVVRAVIQGFWVGVSRKALTVYGH